MTTPLRLLLVEDSPRDAALLVRLLRQASYDLVSERVETAEALAGALDRQEWDLVIADHSMPAFGAMATLEFLRRRHPDLPLIVVSGVISDDAAAGYMQRGAADYLLKDRLGRLANAVRHALEEKRLRAERGRVEQQIRLQARLLDSVEQAVIAIDLAGAIIYWNRFAEVLYGWAGTDVLGRSARFLIPDAIVTEQTAAIMAGLRGGGNWSGEFVVQRRDGSTFPAWVSDSPIHDERGALIGIVGISSDITERKATESALRESEQRYRQVEEHAPIGMALAAPDGRYLRVNPALCALVGYCEGELLTRTVQSLTHPDDLDADLALMRRVLAGEIATYQTEKRYLRKGDSPVWVLLSVSLVRDDDGRPQYFISQVQDITERKRMEQAAAHARAVAEELAEFRRQQAEEAEAMAAVGAALASALDPGTVYQIILAHAARVLPFDHAVIALYRDGWAVSGATLGGPEIAPGTFLVPVNPTTSTWQALTDGKPIYLADTAEVPDWRDPAPWRGPYRVRSMIVVPLLIDGELIGSFQVNGYAPHFYTERHIRIATVFGERATQAVRNARLFAAEQERTRVAEELAHLREEQAQESEALAQVSAALSHTLEPEVLYQAVLDQAARVLPCDLANVLLYREGWLTIVASWGEPAPAIGTRIARLDRTVPAWQPESDAPTYLADTAQEPSWRDVPPNVGEHRVRSLIVVPLVVDGVRVGAFDVCSATPHFYTGRHVRLASLFAERVVHALRTVRLYAAEQERTRAAKALAQQRSDFLASVSHELRTPLTAIVGFGELLQGRWEQFSEAQRLQRIGQIVQAANRQQRLVEDLLLIGSIENASLTPKVVALTLAPMVQQAAAEVQGSYPGQAIVLQGSAELQVRADAARAVQVLVNLLDNAAKYSPEGSPITVSWGPEGDAVALRVVDRGPGVPEEGRDQLFTRFGRLPGSRIRAGRVGTGLGLHISRGLAEAMGGDLDLEATGPEGSTFRLRLPHARDTHGTSACP